MQNIRVSAVRVHNDPATACVRRLVELYALPVRKRIASGFGVVGALGHIMHEVASGQAGASKGVKRATRGSKRPMGYPSTAEDDSTPEFAVGGVVESCDTVKGDYKESARRAAESGSASRGRIKKKRPYSLCLKTIKRGESQMTNITLPPPPAH